MTSGIGRFATLMWETALEPARDPPYSTKETAMRTNWRLGYYSHKAGGSSETMIPGNRPAKADTAALGTSSNAAPLNSTDAAAAANPTLAASIGYGRRHELYFACIAPHFDERVTDAARTFDPSTTRIGLKTENHYARFDTEEIPRTITLQEAIDIVGPQRLASSLKLTHGPNLPPIHQTSTNTLVSSSSTSSSSSSNSTDTAAHNDSHHHHHHHHHHRFTYLRPATATATCSTAPHHDSTMNTNNNNNNNNNSNSGSHQGIAAVSRQANSTRPRSIALPRSNFGYPRPPLRTKVDDDAYWDQFLPQNMRGRPEEVLARLDQQEQQQQQQQRPASAATATASGRASQQDSSASTVWWLKGGNKGSKSKMSAMARTRLW